MLVLVPLDCKGEAGLLTTTEVNLLRVDDLHGVPGLSPDAAIFNLYDGRPAGGTVTLFRIDHQDETRIGRKTVLLQQVQCPSQGRGWLISKGAWQRGREGASDNVMLLTG